MGTGPGTPVPPPAAPVPDPDAAPATRGDLRTLRRWLIVAGVWAVAATAIAVIALIQAGDAKDKASADASSSSSAKLARDNRKQDRDISSLSDTVEKLPSTKDFDALRSDLDAVQKAQTKTAADAKTVSDSVTKLEARVKALEDAAQNGTGGGTDTTTTP